MSIENNLESNKNINTQLLEAAIEVLETVPFPFPGKPSLIQGSAFAAALENLRLAIKKAKGKK